MSIAKSQRLMPLASMEKVILEAGAERVSDDAKVELKRIVEEYSLHIAERAIKFAQHAGRKTIKADDIKLAIKG